jgi:hypothetical protein
MHSKVRILRAVTSLLNLHSFPNRSIGRAILPHIPEITRQSPLDASAFCGVHHSRQFVFETNLHLSGNLLRLLTRFARCASRIVGRSRQCDLKLSLSSGALTAGYFGSVHHFPHSGCHPDSGNLVGQGRLHPQLLKWEATVGEWRFPEAG